MSVKKSALEKLSDKELEKYIVEGNKFVPEANIYAYEILKLRGREFNEIETQRIQSLFEENSKKNEIEIHQNHKKAAALIYSSAGIGVLNIFLDSDSLNSNLGIVVGVITLSIIIAIGYLVNKGNDWIKYVVLGLLILGIFSLPIIFMNLILNPVVGVINITQTFFQIYALVLLFKIPKS